jgi:hypothetical protein
MTGWHELPFFLIFTRSSYPKVGLAVLAGLDANTERLSSFDFSEQFIR